MVIIDKTGKYVIPPQYDYANSFYNGTAKAYIGNKPIYFYKCGKKLKISDMSISRLEGDLFTIVGKNGKEGVWNCKTEKLILDTILDDVVDYNNGVSIIVKYGDKPVNDYYILYNYSMIDSIGNTLIPFDKFNTMSPFYDGISIAGNRRQDYPYWGITGPIDKKGNLLFQMRLAENERFGDRYNDGLAIVILSNKRLTIHDSIDDSSEYIHYG